MVAITSKKVQSNPYRQKKHGYSLFRICFLFIVILQILYFIILKLFYGPLPGSDNNNSASSSSSSSKSNVKSESMSEFIYGGLKKEQEFLTSGLKKKTKAQKQDDDEMSRLPPGQDEEDLGENGSSLRRKKGHEKEEAHLSPAKTTVISNRGTAPQELAYVIDLYHDQLGEYKQVQVKKSDDNNNNAMQSYIKDQEEKVAKLVNTNSVQSCYYFDDETGQMQVQETCQQQQQQDSSITEFVLYNSAPFTRTLCGVSVPPRTAQKLTSEQTTKCSLVNDAVQLLDITEFPPPIPPPGSDKDATTTTTTKAPPIVILPSKDDNNINVDNLEHVQCNIPCMKDRSIPTLMTESNINKYDDTNTIHLFIKDTNWEMIQSIEPPATPNGIKLDRTDYRSDKYYSTLSFKSSVPLSYYNFDLYDLEHTEAMKFNDVTKKATYLLSDDRCISTFSRRHKWYENIESKLGAVSYGSCNHNMNVMNTVSETMTLETIEGRVKIMQKYMFALAFEKTTDKDWITDITWESLLSGSIPVILGAHNVKQEHLPAINAAIIVNEYNEWDKLIDYLKLVAGNETLYNSYHEWRHDDSWHDEFEKKYSFTKTNEFCRTCRWAYAKKYGLGWDHQTQQVQHNYLSNKDKICFAADDEALLIQPFQESWIFQSATETEDVLYKSSSAETNDNNNCIASSSTTLIDKTLGKEDDSKLIVEKSIQQHDGVIDITIKDVKFHEKNNNNGVIKMRLSFEELKNSAGAYFQNTHEYVVDNENEKVDALLSENTSSITVQDPHSKVTILTDWKTAITSPKEGIVDIEIATISPANKNLLSFLHLGGNNKKNKDGGGDKRLRIIIEDINSLHDKMTEYYPSTYAKMMMYDFMDPLQIYYTIEN